MGPNKGNGGSEVVPVADAARLMGISAWTYYDRAKRGELPCIRLGRRVYVPLAKLERLLEQ